MSNKKFEVYKNTKRIQKLLEYCNVKVDNKLCEELNSVKKKNYEMLWDNPATYNCIYNIQNGRENRLLMENKLKNEFTLDEFINWFEEYYLDNFYSGKCFGLKGVGLNVYSKLNYTAVDCLFHRYFEHKRVISMLGLCPTVFEKISADGMELKNKSTVYKEARYKVVAVIRDIETNSWNFEQKNFIETYLHNLTLNECCIFFSLTTPNYLEKLLAVGYILKRNINIYIKD